MVFNVILKWFKNAFTFISNIVVFNRLDDCFFTEYSSIRVFLSFWQEKESKLFVLRLLKSSLLFIDIITNITEIISSVVQYLGGNFIKDTHPDLAWTVTNSESSNESWFWLK